MYNLSKDHDRLFDLLLEGHVAVGFTDNRHDFSPDVVRDVCQIRRHGEYRIVASVRGCAYFSVDPWLKEDSALSERELFCGMCRDANLEWVDQERVERPQDPLGMQLCQAFLQGAKFWEFTKTRATMWQSDQFLVFREAIRKLRDGTIGVTPPPDRKAIEEVMRRG